MAALEISLHQKDDGDGLARYRVAISNDSFSGSSLVWGYAENFDELAAALEGFPRSTSDKVLKQLGSSGVGLANFEFFCVDGSGHAVAWVNLESEYPVHPSNRYETISMCIRIEAAGVDSFVKELHSLASSRSEKATLHGS